MSEMVETNMFAHRGDFSPLVTRAILSLNGTREADSHEIEGFDLSPIGVKSESISSTHKASASRQASHSPVVRDGWVYAL